MKLISAFTGSIPILSNWKDKWFLCLSYQTDPEEWCNQILPHKFSPAPATMFTSVEFINHADDDSFLWSKTGYSYLKY